MAPTDTYDGIISSGGSRIEVVWTPSPPGNTLSSQWDVDIGGIVLYRNDSAPWKNMQNIIFICQFDASTNLAPGIAGQDPEEAPGTDAEIVVGKSITDGVIDVSTNELEITSSSNPWINSEFQKSGNTTYLLNITSGDNFGFYIIEDNTTNTITIKEGSLSGSFSSSETGINAQIVKQTFDSNSSTSSIQADLQNSLITGASFRRAKISLHAWPSKRQANFIHTFEAIPYWLLASELDTNAVIPTWSFTCRCIIREIDQIGYGTTFENYW